MTNTASKSPVSKVTLSRSQDIPFNKLVLSQANVRRVKAGISVEELAEDIARRGLLQGLSVRAVRDADGDETGMYEIPAGGRRYRALELLVKQKRMSKTQAVPCLVRTEGSAEEDSLAENVQRVALHPLDQFRAFQTLRDQGLDEDEIAARFFVTPAVVKQRLKLASVSPKLLDLYAADAMSLEQLMAFTVTGDHARQEQVWDAISRGWNKEPYLIRRQLTEGAVSAADKRAQFVGVEAYEAAGGVVTRDLFEDDEGGWLQDSALLDRLVGEKLTREAHALRAEGWKWIEAAVEFPYGHTRGLRRLAGEERPLSDEEQASYDALQAELEKLEQDYAEADEYPEEVDARLGEIETALAAFDSRPAIYEPAGIACAGAFVSIDSGGELAVERGFVRRGDQTAPDAGTDVDRDDFDDADDDDGRGATVTVSGRAVNGDGETEEDGLKPLPDRLVTELTAWRTLALRDALAGDPDTAILAVLHALCLNAFYHYGSESCLELSVKSSSFGMQTPALKDSVPAKAIEARHDAWLKQLPEEPAALWDALTAFDADSRSSLFAHCAALSINAVHQPWNRSRARIAHADQLAHYVGLDPVAAGWTTTVDNYLGRLTKSGILEAVREAKGEASAQLIDHLKKPEMAKEAERLIAGASWLPQPLRCADAPLPTDRSDVDDVQDEEASDGPAVQLPAFLTAESDGAIAGADGAGLEQHAPSH